MDRRLPFLWFSVPEETAVWFFQAWILPVCMILAAFVVLVAAVALIRSYWQE